MTPQNKRVMACVVDTECTYISKSPNMVFHFGAVFGDITQQHSLYTKEMDYYCLEIIEQIDLFLHTNRKGEDYAVNGAMRNAWKDAIRNPHKVKKWKHIIEEFNENINSMGIEYITSYNFKTSYRNLLASLYARGACNEGRRRSRDRVLSAALGVQRVSEVYELSVIRGTARVSVPAVRAAVHVCVGCVCRPFVRCACSNLLV